MMHDDAREWHIRQMKAADRALMDYRLDQFGDALFRATEWDAQQWGFDPERWQADERAQLMTRGGRNWPTEVI
jgi:alpha-L-fucosidase